MMKINDDEIALLSNENSQIFQNDTDLLIFFDVAQFFQIFRLCSQIYNFFPIILILRWIYHSLIYQSPQK